MKFKQVLVFSILFILIISLNGCQAGRSIFLPHVSSTDGQISLNPQEYESQETNPSAEDVYRLTDDIYIESVFSYSGQYVEDGSNDPCENIAAVRIVNHSDKPYQYIRFEITTASATYTFSGSTLLEEIPMTILNEEKAVFQDDQILANNLLNLSPFIEAPSLYTDHVQITYTDRFLNIKNLTDHTLNHIYVYYKNLDQNGFLGGITYRSAFDKVDSGQIVQNITNNIHKDSSRIVFVTFDDNNQGE